MSKELKTTNKQVNLKRIIRHLTSKTMYNQPSLKFYLVRIIGSLSLSGKLPTYPSPKPPLTLFSDLGQNVGLGEG